MELFPAQQGNINTLIYIQLRDTNKNTIVLGSNAPVGGWVSINFNFNTHPPAEKIRLEYLQSSSLTLALSGLEPLPQLWIGVDKL